MAAEAHPALSLSTTPDYGNLDPESYTAQRLIHASPEHLHLTSRRFFIGPIPQGWLNSNRKTWYRRILKQREHRYRNPSFIATTAPSHQRSPTFRLGLSARNEFSFPQPQDAYNDGFRCNSAAITENGRFPDSSDRQDVSQESTGARIDEGPLPRTALPDDSLPAESSTFLTVPSRRRNISTSGESAREGEGSERPALSNSPAGASFVTARQRQESDESVPGSGRIFDDSPTTAEIGLDHPSGPGDSQPVSSRTSSQPPMSIAPGDANSLPGRANSITPLLSPNPRPTPSRASAASLRPLSLQQPDPVNENDVPPPVSTRINSKGVRFAIAEGITTGHQRMKKRTTGIQTKQPERDKTGLQDGVVVKMERMLVRIEVTSQSLSDEYDENHSYKTETRVADKWQELIVVLRKSQREPAHFRLQMYKSRVIPEIEKDGASKRPQHEVVLNRQTAKVNLYSSLDKTMVLWHPHKKGNRIIIMRPRSTAHSAEWYTLLKEKLGWERPSSLQINVPDLSVSLCLQKPFERLELARKSVGDIQGAISPTQVMAEEQAVAAKMIRQCMEMLRSSTEWADVLESWAQTKRLGLAWKRYDRLEWVHGANERRMYGSMALQKSHELELRPKQHYPTNGTRKGRVYEEPAPVEGFLIRLATHDGVRQRLGLAPYKRLYLASHNQFLLFHNPSRVTPPSPPRLATITGSNIPSATEIIDSSPTMYAITPYSLRGGSISWVNDMPATVRDYDRKAAGESQRNLDNISNCDGFINLCRVVKVREMHWGAASVDDRLDSGSDVDFHEHESSPRVGEGTASDGTTRTVDNQRTFELVMDNEQVVRLQAYDNVTMKEWMRRLRALVKYWKMRTVSDVLLFKSVRQSNLKNLNIDEEMEATVGQFARKWEVARCEASPELYNMCGLSSCRPIVISGPLYRKPRRHATFTRCSVILANGALMVFQAAKRKITGQQLPYTHQDRQDTLQLRDCYIYSGLITQGDLLYTNRTFDSNKPGNYALPRMYREHGGTPLSSVDDDAMVCFVIWHGLRRSYFRSPLQSSPGSATADAGDIATVSKQSNRRAFPNLNPVSRLGGPGRAVVFKCRSRAERDHWVMSIGVEIDRLQR